MPRRIEFLKILGEKRKGAYWLVFFSSVLSEDLNLRSDTSIIFLQQIISGKLFECFLKKKKKTNLKKLLKLLFSSLTTHNNLILIVKML